METGVSCAMRLITEQRDTRVIDGATFETALGPSLIGLAGVDVRGLRNKAGEALRKSLEKLISGKYVRIEAIGEDADGRILARVDLEGRSVNDLVREGASHHDGGGVQHSF
jgi:endonuclease YncB( thermonuclease family)